MNQQFERGAKCRIKGLSQYFARKYGTSNPEFYVEVAKDFRSEFNPAAFLYSGRMLAEGISTDGITYYGHIDGLGEYVHESELERV